MKVQQYYGEIPETCRDVALGYVTHYENVKMVSSGFAGLSLVHIMENHNLFLHTYQLGYICLSFSRSGYLWGG